MEGKTLASDHVGILDSTKLAVWQGAQVETLSLKFTGSWQIGVIEAA